MGWKKISERAKRCKCRTPRVRRQHGDGSQWQCDTCHLTWELHRTDHGHHWSRYGCFCEDCGPARAYRVGGEWYGGTNPRDFPGIATGRPAPDTSWITTELVCGNGRTTTPQPLDPPRQTGTGWLYSVEERP